MIPRKRFPVTAERFWQQVDRRGPDECWPWTGRTTTGGYGQARIPGVKGSRNAHRAAWYWTHGSVPDGHLDHLCHSRDQECPGGPCPHRLCCNPAHLEPVTSAENNARGHSPAAENAQKTHCPKGHPYSGDNVRYRPNGKGRECRACDRIKAIPKNARRAERRAQQKSVAA